MTDEIEEYIEQHIEPVPDYLERIERRIHSRLLYTRMCSGKIQGRLLKMLTRMINPRRVLELGTYGGYSALCIAEGLSRPDATIDTIEIFDELEDFIKESFAETELGRKITLHIGDASEIVPALDKTWDMIYIDANKRNYVDYYNLLFDRLTPGGYIIADNTLWDGKVAVPATEKDVQTAGICEFNELVAADNRVEKIILPLRDGLTIIRKKSNQNPEK